MDKKNFLFSFVLVSVLFTGQTSVYAQTSRNSWLRSFEFVSENARPLIGIITGVLTFRRFIDIYGPTCKKEFEEKGVNFINFYNNRTVLQECIKIAEKKERITQLKNECDFLKDNINMTYSLEQDCKQIDQLYYTLYPNENEIVFETITETIGFIEQRIFKDYISSDTQLFENDVLESYNGRFRLHIYSSGNLVIYDNNYNQIWASNTINRGKQGYKLIMQSDGNLVIYDGDGFPTWASNTNNISQGPYILVMQDDGNLVIYDRYRRPIWATDTCCR